MDNVLTLHGHQLQLYNHSDKLIAYDTIQLKFID